MKLSTCIHRFFDQYLNRVKGCRENTVKAYRDTFTLFLPFAADYYKIRVSNLEVEHLSIDLILDFLEYLESQRNNTTRTRNHRLAAIKSFAKMIRIFYPEQRLIAEKILNLQQKSTQKKLIGFLYIEEILATYKAVDLRVPTGFRDYTILHLLTDSGIRASELAMLRLDDFIPEHSTLGVLGKGNKFRLIELEQKTTHLIKRYISDYRSRPKPLFGHRLFINKHRRELTRKGVYLLCRKHLAKVLSPKRLKEIDPVHCFRHSCAVNMLAQGRSLSDIKNRLGHENIESTKVYLHMDLRNKRKVQEKFLEYMQSTLKHDPKLDDLIAWENKQETLDWLDTL
jgi:site-specific recombinase XerD